MNRKMMLVAAAVVVTGAVSCGDQPTAPLPNAAESAAAADASAQRAPGKGVWKHSDRAALLTAVPVSGKLSDGGTFAGTITARRIDIDQATRALTMSGTLVGTATTADGRAVPVTQEFKTPITLARTAGGAAAASMFHPTAMAVCDVLFLDLGPLHLDLLGLTVDLAEVVLDVNAVSGSGNLLGNLLCAVLGLLDIPGAIAGILQLLDSINAILAGLNPAGVTGAGLVSPSPFVHGAAAIAWS